MWRVLRQNCLNTIKHARFYSNQIVCLPELSKKEEKLKMELILNRLKYVVEKGRRQITDANNKLEKKRRKQRELWVGGAGSARSSEFASKLQPRLFPRVDQSDSSATCQIPAGARLPSGVSLVLGHVEDKIDVPEDVCKKPQINKTRVVLESNSTNVNQITKRLSKLLLIEDESTDLEENSSSSAVDTEEKRRLRKNLDRMQPKKQNNS